MRFTSLFLLILLSQPLQAFAGGQVIRPYTTSCENRWEQKKDITNADKPCKRKDREEYVPEDAENTQTKLPKVPEGNPKRDSESKDRKRNFRGKKSEQYKVEQLYYVKTGPKISAAEGRIK